MERAIDGFRLTGGLYDPTLLGPVIRAGYDRTFELIPAAARPGRSDAEPACAGIGFGPGWARLPAGSGFDPGGIGKGLAADIVASELVAAGADGVCVNLGGDVRVTGEAPGGGTWTVAVEHPAAAAPIALLGLADGAVATSTTLRRRWRVGGEVRHHLIDPATRASERRRDVPRVGRDRSGVGCRGAGQGGAAGRRPRPGGGAPRHRRRGARRRHGRAHLHDAGPRGLHGRSAARPRGMTAAAG